MARTNPFLGPEDLKLVAGSGFEPGEKIIFLIKSLLMIVLNKSFFSSGKPAMVWMFILNILIMNAILRLTKFV